MRTKRAFLRLGVVLAVLVVFDQVALYTVLGDDRLFGRRIAPFDPPIFSPSQEASLQRIRDHLEGGGAPLGALGFDPELGWCPPPERDTGASRTDWAGCRVGVAPLARAKPAGVRRILVFGCSFTFGEEVSGADTWAAQLDAALGDIEVGNLGVSAFGLDQALLRYRRDGRTLEADEVWLGVLPAAALRVSTLYRPAFRHWSLDVSFKPRLVLGAEGELEVVPNPARDLRHVVRMMESQDEFLARLGGRDHWVERCRAAYAPRGTSLAHHSFAARLVLTALESRERDVRPWLEDTDGELARLLVALMRAMARECAEAGARFRVLVLPGKPDLEHVAREGEGYWAAWTRVLGEEGIEVVDLTGTLLEAGALERADLWAPSLHYSPRGNRVVADALADVLRLP